jgi:hypothetical protein
MAQAIARKTNSKGVTYALVQDGESFGVYVRRENYAAHRKGGLSVSWRYVEKDMTRAAAQNLFDRRAA